MDFDDELRKRIDRAKAGRRAEEEARRNAPDTSARDAEYARLWEQLLAAARTSADELRAAGVPIYPLFHVAERRFQHRILDYRGEEVWAFHIPELGANYSYVCVRTDGQFGRGNHASPFDQGAPPHIDLHDLAIVWDSGSTQPPRPVWENRDFFAEDGVLVMRTRTSYETEEHVAVLETLLNGVAEKVAEHAR